MSSTPSEQQPASPCTTAPTANSHDVKDNGEQRVPPAALSFEEFRELYVARRRHEHALQKALMQSDDAEGVRRRGPGGVVADATSGEQQPVNMQAAPLAQHAALEWGAWSYRLLLGDAENILELLVRISVASAIFFQELSILSFFSVLGFHIFYVVVMYFIRSIRVEREDAAGNRRPHHEVSTLARICRAGLTERAVPTHRKVLYAVLKSAMAFVLSAWPNYSVDKLEVELQLDGIVREPPVEPAAAPAPVAGG